MFALAGAVTAIWATPALGAETRAEYVAQTDRICKDTNREFKRLAKVLGPVEVTPVDPDESKPTQKELNRGEKLLTRYIGRTNRVFGQMVREIAFVPIPAGDEQTVADWLSGLRAYRRLTDRANRRLQRDQFNKAGLLFERSLQSLQNGALAVRDWGYKWCPAGDIFV